MREVIEQAMLDKVKQPLSAVKPMKAVFDPQYVKRINGPHVKQAPNNMDKARMLMDDIRRFKDESGAIFHTYSAYARGLDILAGAYNFLDLVPKGRAEAALPWSMAWVRRHDEYDDSQPSSCCGSQHDDAA